MAIIAHLYKKKFVYRYDKEVGIPYYSHTDFKGLIEEEYSFVNSKNITIKFFYYYYPNYHKDKIILFCPGIGSGHVAYFSEINELAKRGYKVLTLDYTGCGESGGKCLYSLNMPTLDVNELLNYLNLKQTINVVGHSLGGYTALNIINLRREINHAVIISGFLNVDSLVNSLISSKFIASRINKYEKGFLPSYSGINNIEYLKTTKDKLFFIHSTDDQMVPYNISTKVVEEINNPHIKVVTVNHRKHNPNYTPDAVNYMNEIFGKYQNLINNKIIKTDEEKINYFKDVSLARLTAQDEKMFDEIVTFIK